MKTNRGYKEQINYLGLTIKRHTDHIPTEIYKKPTSTNITIHYTSNHPMEHKIAVYRYLINRVNSVPITDAKKTRVKQHNKYN